MKKLKHVINSLLITSSPLIAAACSIEQSSNNGNGLNNLTWTIPSGNEISYSNNLLFWLNFVPLLEISQNEGLSGKQFVDFINRYDITQTPLVDLPSGSTVNFIDTISSLNVDQGSDKLGFSVNVAGSPKRYELKWKVNISPVDYLDAWLKTINKFELSTNIYDHNRVVNFVREANINNLWVYENYATKLFELIGDLDSSLQIKNFKRSGLKVNFIRAAHGNLNNLVAADLLSNNRGGLIIGLIYEVDNQQINRELVFAWDINILNSSATSAWQQNRKLKINLTDFNKMVDELNGLDQSSFVYSDVYAAKSLIQLIKKYVGSQQIDSFSDIVFVKQIEVPKNLVGDSIQETLKFLVAEKDDSGFSNRKIKVDFEVRATDLEIINSWTYSNATKLISPSTLKNFVTVAKGIDQNDTAASASVFWSILSTTFPTGTLQRFPTGASVYFDSSQFDSIGAYNNGKNITVAFKLVVGVEQRQINIAYTINATEQEELDGLKFNYLYVMDSNEFSILRTALMNLNVGASAVELNEIFDTKLPANLQVPVLPNFVELDSKIFIGDHTGHQSVRDLIVRVKGANGVARKELLVARIIVSSNPTDLLDAIMHDTTIALIDESGLSDFSASVTQLLNNSSVDFWVLQRLVTKYWQPILYMPTGARIVDISIPPSLSYNNTYSLTIKFELAGEYREIQLSFKYIKDLYDAGYMWKAPESVQISSLTYLDFANAVNALIDDGEIIDAVDFAEAIDIAFAGATDYIKIKANLGKITEITKIPTFINGAKFIGFRFRSESASYTMDHYLSIEIVNTEAQALQAWANLMPNEVNISVANYNLWFETVTSLSTDDTTKSNYFMTLLFGSIGEITVPALEEGTTITSWLLVKNRPLFENTTNSITINLANATTTITVSIDLIVSIQLEKILTNYFQHYSASKRHLKLNATQFNTLVNVINETFSDVPGTDFFENINDFIRAWNLNVTNPNNLLTELNSNLVYKVDYKLDYQLIDFYGMYSTLISFQINGDSSTRISIPFTFEVIPDYQLMLDELTEIYRQTPAVRITNIDLISFVNEYNQIVDLEDSYLKALRLNALLKIYGFIDETPLFLNGINFELDKLLAINYSLSSFPLSISYSVPGINQLTHIFNVTVDRSLAELVSTIQPNIQDAQVTYTQFQNFVNSWNLLSNTATTAQILSVLNTRFSNINLPLGSKLVKTTDIQHNLNIQGNLIGSNENIYTFGLKVLDEADDETLDVIYFTFVIDINDDAILSIINVPNYALTGTRKRFISLYEYSQQNQYTGTNGKINFLNEIKKLFDSDINLPVNGINFRTINFSGSWNSVTALNSSSKISIVYGYGNSTATKTFNLNVNLTTDQRAILEDFSNFKLNTVNFRTYKTLDADVMRVNSIFTLDNFFDKYLPSSLKPRFDENWGSKLTFVTMINLNENLVFDDDKKANAKYIVMLKYTDAGSDYIIQVLVEAPIVYDVLDQTKDWTVRSLNYQDTRDLMKAQEFFLAKYPENKVSDNKVFLQDLNDQFLKLNIKSIVPFDDNVEIVIPEKGLISGVHLLENNPVVTLDFQMKYGSETYNRFIQFNYRRNDADLFNLYEPYHKPQTGTGEITMLYSEYEDFRSTYNFALLSSVNQYINIASIYNLIDAKLVANGYVKKVSVPEEANFGIYISPYTMELGEPEVGGDGFLPITVKTGAMSKQSAEIKFFEFKIKILTELTDVAKTKLVDNIWKGLEHPQYRNAAMQNRFHNSINLVDHKSQSTYGNLMNHIKLQEKIEGDLGIVIGDRFNIPKGAGNKEILYGFSSKSSQTLTSSYSTTVDHAEKGDYDNLKPLTKSVYRVLTEMGVEDVPVNAAPSFTDNPKYHPNRSFDGAGIASVVVPGAFGVASLGVSAAIGVQIFRDWRGANKSYNYNDWLQWYRTNRSENAIINFDKLQSAVEQGIKPPASTFVGDPLSTTSFVPDVVVTPSIIDRVKYYFNPDSMPQGTTVINPRHSAPTGLPSAAGTFPNPSRPTIGGVGSIVSSATPIHDMVMAPVVSGLHSGLGGMASNMSALEMALPIADYRIISWERTANGFAAYNPTGDITSQGLLEDVINLSVGRNQPVYSLARMDTTRGLPPGMQYSGPGSDILKQRYPDRIYLNTGRPIQSASLADVNNPANYISRKRFESGKEAIYGLVFPDQQVGYRAVFDGNRNGYLDIDVIKPETAKYQVLPDQKAYERARQATFDSKYGSKSTVGGHVDVARTTSPTPAPKPASRIIPRRPSAADASDFASTALDSAPGELVPPPRRTRHGSEFRTARSPSLSSSEGGLREYFSTDEVLMAPPRRRTTSGSISEGTTPIASQLAGDVDVSRIPGRAVRSTSRFSPKYQKIALGVTAAVGALMTIGSFVLGMWQSGIWFTNKSNHFDNSYDKEDKTDIKTAVLVNDYELTAYLVERTSGGDIATVEPIKRFEFRLSNEMYDYDTPTNKNSLSTPVDFIVKQLTTSPDFEDNFERKKVNVNAPGVPSAFKNNNRMLSGSWLGYLQMYPLLQSIDSLEIALKSIPIV